MDLRGKAQIDLLNRHFQNYGKQAVLEIFSPALSFVKVKGYYEWNNEMCCVLPKFNFQGPEDVSVDIYNVVAFLLFCCAVFQVLCQFSKTIGFLMISGGIEVD